MKRIKICSLDECGQPLFARGYCIRHYRSHYLAPKAATKEKKNYTIPKVSKKTLERNKKYTHERIMFVAKYPIKSKTGLPLCIFCNAPITGEPSLHHGLGRDDENMLNKDTWFLSHNFCHVAQYHSMSWSKIHWWLPYIERMKTLNLEIYELELKKMNK